MALNPQKTIMNGDEYEYASAEVIDVDYSDIDSSRLYKIRCKLIGAFGSQPSTAFFEARPLHSNIKQFFQELFLVSYNSPTFSQIIKI